MITCIYNWHGIFSAYVKNLNLKPFGFFNNFQVKKNGIACLQKKIVSALHAKRLNFHENVCEMCSTMRLLTLLFLENPTFVLRFCSL